MKKHAILFALAVLTEGLQANPSPSPTPPPTSKSAPLSKVLLTPEQSKELGEIALKNLSKYNYGDATDAVFNVSEFLRKGTSETRSQFEPKLVAILKDPASSQASKETICRWLGWMGGEKAVPVLAKIAESTSNDPKNADGMTGGYAVRALAMIPVKTADQFLVQLLSSTSDDRRLAVMSAVRIRGTAAAIPQLTKIAALKSPALSGAAFEALASFRTADALKAILHVDVMEGNAPLKNAAVINAASGFLAKAGHDDALPAAASKKLAVIAGSDVPYAQRLSALRVLLSAGLPAGEKEAVALLKNQDFRLRDGTAEALVEFASPAQLKSIAWNETPDAWLVLLNGLTRKANPATLPIFQNALGSTDQQVRLAAIGGIVSCGGLKGMDLLSPLLTDSNPMVANAAANALSVLKGSTVNDRLIALEATSKPELAGIMLAILAARQDHKAFDLALQAINSTDPTLLSAGYKAIAQLSTAGDLAKCLPLVAKVKGSNTEDLQKAVIRATILDPSPSVAASQIAASFDQGGPEQKENLIQVLARLEVKEANAKLVVILASPDVELRKQVIRALASARNTTSLALLPAVAAKGQSDVEKILALRGYIDTLGEFKDLNNGQRVAGYLAAWNMALRDEEKSAICSAVKRIPENKIPNSLEAKALLEAIQPKSTVVPAPATK